MATPPAPLTERRGPFAIALWRYPGKGGWVFARLSAAQAPPVTHPWGRTPVTATVDGVTWRTSVFRDAKSKGAVLGVPKRVRGSKDDGDKVTVEFEFALDPD